MTGRLVGFSVACALVAAAWVVPSQAQATLPSGFVDEPVASVSFPTALAFAPDGRLLVTTQGGQLRVLEGGTLLPTPALTLGSRVCTNSERGLLGVAVDPAFTPLADNWVYLYYTHNDSVAGGCQNRIARFRLPPSNVVDPASEQVLVDDIGSPGGNHNGGDLHFGKDGLLYASVGDGGTDLDGTGCCQLNDNARHPELLLGKILRIEKDGGIPPGNPFQGAATARCNVTGGTSPGTTCREIFASGLRNPFRLAFDHEAPGTRFFINDVGQGRAEEVDVGQSGADYGWNVCEAIWSASSGAPCTQPAGAVPPVHFYRHDDGQNCRTITGGAFVPTGAWPADYDRDYLYGDYICGKIFRLENDGSSRREFAAGLGGGSIVAVTFRAGEQALYYATYAPSTNPQVRRIRFTGVPNRTPTAVAVAEPPSGPAPLAVTFDARGSSDPDGDALAFSWDLDGDGAFGDSTSATPARTYAAGTHTVRVRVTDGRGGDDTASTTVRADERPAPPVSARAPAATGRALVGELLRADPGVWDGADPITLEYRWERCDRAGRRCAVVGGAVLRAYRIRAADLGRRLRVAVTARNAAGSATARSAVTAPVASAVAFVRIRPQARTLNGEWVELRNRAQVAVSLRGWSLRNGAGAAYRFGAAAVPAGATVRVHTGRGRETERHRYWQRSGTAWNDVRGRARLHTPGGRLADACRYARVSRSVHAC